MAKSQEEGAQEKLDAVLYTAAEYIRVITALVAPVLPATAIKIWRMLGMPYPIEDARFVDLAEQSLAPGQKVEPVAALFPRIEAKQAIEKMQELEVAETRRQAALFGKVLAAIEEPVGLTSIGGIAFSGCAFERRANECCAARSRRSRSMTSSRSTSVSAW